MPPANPTSAIKDITQVVATPTDVAGTAKPDRRKLNPAAVNSEEILKTLVNKLHGSGQGISGKNPIVLEINNLWSHCSKASIEKKSKEVARSGLVCSYDLYVE